MGKLKILIKKGIDVYVLFISFNDYGEIIVVLEC